ncbi:hypothetical protein T07_14137 [Trichinella nelsoni]|uniref:Uncharacterized protein n=1 Tax=Trichinella nelsoni TaxID=6336 RepID=A0A0V0S070_9BILA|nr:hypothetical protein T07_14137 [Trichinella nelsoni]
MSVLRAMLRSLLFQFYLAFYKNLHFQFANRHYICFDVLKTKNFFDDAMLTKVVHLSTGQLWFTFSCSFEVANVLRKLKLPDLDFNNFISKFLTIYY